MTDVIRPLKVAAQIVGAVVLVMAVLGSLGLAEFRMCFVPAGSECKFK